MNIDELRKHPAIKAHFSEVARALDEYLVAHLVSTCAGSDGMAEHAQAEIGAAAAIAHVIQTFRSLNNTAPEPKPFSIGRPLHRFTPKPETES